MTVKLTWLVNTILFLTTLGAGGAIQAAAGGLDGASEGFGTESGSSVVVQNAGYRRFVVEPWADVYIDGEHVLTTPSARRVALAPGRHWVKFQNQYYPEVNQEIWVQESETEVIEINLEADADDPGASTVPDGGTSE